MLLSSFITNPTLRIIIFILFLLPAIIVVNFFSMSFFYFAAYAIVISILFPIYFYTLDQSAVDFWYYTLGILGVVILFSSQFLVAKTHELSNLMVQAKEHLNFLDELSDDIYTYKVQHKTCGKKASQGRETECTHDRAEHKGDCGPGRITIIDRSK